MNRSTPTGPSNAKVITREAPFKNKPELEAEVLTSIDPATLDESCVYVHCYFENAGTHNLIRVWKSTFLTDAASGARSALLHAENISYAPQWTVIPNGSPFSFLLIFAGLPKSCLKFDLREEIPQPGGFHVRNIPRNETDVYHVDIA